MHQDGGYINEKQYIENGKGLRFEQDSPGTIGFCALEQI